jgi:uncharacterized protein YqiB (DUF1249 family)
MADPDMEIRIHEATRTAEVLSFQQDSMGIYVTACPQPGNIDLHANREMSEFLLQWLSNLKEQGFFPPRFEKISGQREPIQS